MKQFAVMVKLEFLKLRGTYFLLTGVVTAIGSIVLGLYLAAADRTTNYTFLIFTENVIINNMSLFFPFTAVLTVGQMMEQERTCSTLNNLFAIPIRFQELLSAKIATGAVMAALYAILQWILSASACMLLGLPGITVPFAFLRLANMIGINLCIYIAVLPVIALTAQYAGGYMAGAGFSVFYGFCSVFATGRGFTAIYPISAGTVLFRLHGTPAFRECISAVLSLAVVLILAVVFIAASQDRAEGVQPAPGKK